GTQLLEPVAQPGRRDAVLAVVALDGLDVRREARVVGLARLDGPLDRAAARGRGAQVLLALEAEERLELLDRIALDARFERVLDDGVEVDEELGAQDRVELGLACRVAARQALERRRLVRAEVIDVHVGMRAERLENAVDHRLEGLLFLGRRLRPERRVASSLDAAEEI